MYQEVNAYCKEKGVVLVAVSKTKSVEEILEKYDQGQRIFGENRVQELLEKKEALPKDIEWHMIGKLQRNKVKYIVPFIDLIHSVDSNRLLNEIQKETAKIAGKTSVLLQLKIARESTKSGMNKQEILSIISEYIAGNYPNIVIKGLMGMASFVEDTKLIKAEFIELQTLYDEIKTIDGLNHSFDIKSMGMSQDYQLAVDTGSNMVRIGSLLFGKR